MLYAKYSGKGYTKNRKGRPFEHNSGMIDLDSILNMIELGGDMCGLGEWRIEKGGSCGKFHVNKNFD